MSDLSDTNSDKSFSELFMEDSFQGLVNFESLYEGIGGNDFALASSMPDVDFSGVKDEELSLKKSTVKSTFVKKVHPKGTKRDADPAVHDEERQKIEKRRKRQALASSRYRMRKKHQENEIREEILSLKLAKAQHVEGLENLRHHQEGYNQFIELKRKLRKQKLSLELCYNSSFLGDGKPQQLNEKFVEALELRSRFVGFQSLKSRNWINAAVSGIPNLKLRYRKKKENTDLRFDFSFKTDLDAPMVSDILQRYLRENHCTGKQTGLSKEVIRAETEIWSSALSNNTYISSDPFLSRGLKSTVSNPAQENMSVMMLIVCPKITKVENYSCDILGLKNMSSIIIDPISKVVSFFMLGCPKETIDSKSYLTDTGYDNFRIFIEYVKKLGKS
eukprot:augustus_masked-scaffold_5-processed-gene-7.45-mRNA-1 protein AED:1.00 eAED:1.00 QI:0/-1/0/0/-1/1/1/0/388